MLKAKYPVTIAEQIAADSTVDLHKAVEMRQLGCPAATAAEILLS